MPTWPPQSRKSCTGLRPPFVQVIYDIDAERMAFGRNRADRRCRVRSTPPRGGRHREGMRRRMGPARFAARCPAAIRWTRSPAGSRASSRSAASLLERAREMGDRSQFHRNWVPGEPSLRLGPVRTGPVGATHASPLREASVQSVGPGRSVNGVGRPEPAPPTASRTSRPRSIRHSNSTRFSSMAGSRSA